LEGETYILNVDRWVTLIMDVQAF